MGKIFWIVVVFLLVGSYMIVLNNSYNIKDTSDQKTFITKFSQWVVGVGKNVFRVVGYATKMDWLPEKDSDRTVINNSNSSVQN